jgi:hypothetical protein
MEIVSDDPLRMKRFDIRDCTDLKVLEFWSGCFSGLSM